MEDAQIPGQGELIPTGGDGQPQELAVEVKSLIFRSASDDFAVVQALDAAQRRLILTGPLAYLHDGEHLTVRGSWREHPRYGLRFEVCGVAHLPLTGKKAVIAALSSVKHIGPRSAELLYERHGENTLSVVDADPRARLRELPGIGAVRSAEAAESWRALRAGRELHMFLAEHDVPAALAGRIQRAWGERSLQTLRDRPYAICALPGIGFRSADALAQSLGIPASASERIEAALHYALTDAEQDGHCYLPLKRLQGRAARLLGERHDQTQAEDFAEEQIDPALPFEAVENLLSSGALIAPRGVDDGESPVYEHSMYEAEQRLAVNVAALAQAAPLLDSARAVRPETGPFTPTDVQWQSVLMALGHRLSILTGGPGTGKTATVRALVCAASAQGAKVGLCAPTGKAAKRLASACDHPAGTIHRLLEWQPGHGFMRDGSNRLEGLGMLIVDEASMLALRLADSLFQAIGQNCHVLLVGDADQLAPIGPGRVLDDLIASQSVPVIALQEIFRQARRSLIVRAAHAINGGSLPQPAALGNAESHRPAALPQLLAQSGDDDVAYQPPAGDTEPIRDFFWLKRASEEEVSAEVLSLVCERIPERFGVQPRREIQVLSPMRRGAAGLVALNSAIRGRLNPEGQRVPGGDLRVGDRVIQSRNDYEHELMNGEVGLLLSDDPSRERVLLEIDGERRLTLPYGALESIQLAYAISIHKAQGSQAPVVIVALGRAQRMMLTRNLLYTAVTRAERLCILVAQNGSVELALQRRDSRARFTGLAAALQGN